jgi:hypothetical protein
VEPDIYLLELADGIKDVLINAGFPTIKSILKCTTSEISSKIGVDLFVAQIILEEAQRVSTEMTQVPAFHDSNPTVTPPVIAIDREELSLV